MGLLSACTDPVFTAIISPTGSPVSTSVDLKINGNLIKSLNVTDAVGTYVIVTADLAPPQIVINPGDIVEIILNP